MQPYSAIETAAREHVEELHRAAAAARHMPTLRHRLASILRRVAVALEPSPNATLSHTRS